MKLAIEIDDDDLGKLLELVGNKVEVSDFFSMAIRKLHKQHSVFGDNDSLDQMILRAEAMKEENHSLRARLNKLTRSQQELMATVNHIRTLSADMRNDLNKRRYAD